MKPSVRDKYRGADHFVNAICYDLTDGGDLVRGKPHTWDALRSHVWHHLQLYRDTKHYTRARVDAEVATWLEVNERKGSAQ